MSFFIKFAWQIVQYNIILNSFSLTDAFLGVSCKTRHMHSHTLTNYSIKDSQSHVIESR